MHLSCFHSELTTHRYSYNFTCAHTHGHTCTHTHGHTCTHTHMGTLAHTHMGTLDTHMGTLAHTHGHTCTHMGTLAHTYGHTCTHTHGHTCTHIWAGTLAHKYCSLYVLYFPTLLFPLCSLLPGYESLFKPIVRSVMDHYRPSCIVLQVGNLERGVVMGGGVW